MATYQRADLRKRVLSKLGVLDAVEAPEAADDVLANDHAQGLLEELYDNGLIPFDLDTDEIPARYMNPLASLIAQELVADYGAFAREASISAAAVRGMKSLYRMKVAAYFGTPTAVDYF